MLINNAEQHSHGWREYVCISRVPSFLNWIPLHVWCAVMNVRLSTRAFELAVIPWESKTRRASERRHVTSRIRVAWSRRMGAISVFPMTVEWR